MSMRFLWDRPHADDAAADRGRLVIMALMGFGSGLPYLLLGTTLTFWLVEQGVSIALIGVSAWFALPYSFKPLWASAVDRFGPPLMPGTLGHGLGWLLLSQLAVMLGLAGVAMLDVRTQFVPLALIASLTALAAANQDMFVDAHRIASPAGPRGAAHLLLAYQIGYRGGMFVAGSIVLILAQHIGWPGAYRAAAVLMLLPAAATLAGGATRDGRRFDPTARAGRSVTLRTAFRTYLGRGGKWPVGLLLGVSLFRLPDLIAEPMKNPFLHVYGALPETVGVAQGMIGLPAGIAGIATGSLMLSRVGIRRALAIASFVQCMQMAIFALFTVSDGQFAAVGLLVGIDNFASAVTGTVLVAVISAMVAPSRAIVEFSFLTASYALLAKLVRGGTGFVLDGLLTLFGQDTGYCLFFLGLAVAGMPGFFLIGRSAGESIPADAALTRP